MAFGTHRECLRLTALLCTALIAPGELPVLAQQPAAGAPQQPAGAAQQPAPNAQQQPPAADAPKLKTPEQLDSMVAPIALYPDPLLAQVLAAATYPLNIVEAQRWLKANPNLKGEELTKAAAKQDWDASVQALVAFPQALKLLDDNIQWTTDLGNAFLDQQGDLMDAVQRMRKKAKDAGKLETTKEQKVEVKTVESKTVVEIQPASPQVIYVPSYNPTVVYGPPVYAYPPIVYPPPPPPPSTGAIIATAAVSFGVGVMMGAMWSGCCGGGYGWGCHWGGSNNVVINNNFNTRYGYNNVNNINRNNINNVNGGNRTNIGNTNRSGNSTWQHNPSHRGAVPYDSRNTAQQFGGSARDSSGRMQRYDRSGQARPTAAENGFNRDAANRNSAGNRAQTGERGGQDRVGNRSFGGEGGRQGSALSGSESRARTQAASDRGFSSTRESRGGGGGGGGRFGGGGGGRSGGGRRR